MLFIHSFLFVIIKVSMSCNDFNQISFLPPFQNVRNVQLISGKDLNIVCCHPHGADSLSWLDKSSNKILSKQSNGIFTLKDEKDRLILRIDNFDEKIAGEYTCTNTRLQLSKKVNLSASAFNLSPEIRKKELLFPNNKPVQIRCPLTSNQGFNSWIFKRAEKKFAVNSVRDDVDYEVTEEGKLFTVKMNKKGESIDILWCQYNEVSDNGDTKTGLYQMSWKLYDPIDIELVIDNKGPILESNDVKIICSFRYNDMISIKFPKGDLKPNFVVDNKNLSKGRVVLTISKITKDQEGEYECKITKILNIMPFTVVEESAKVRVTVTTPPTIIKDLFVTPSAKLNDEVYLKCQIKSSGLQTDDAYYEYFDRQKSSWVKLYDGSSKYGVTMIKNGSIIIILNIRSITWEDRGKYRCVVRNAAGEDTMVQDLRIEKVPELKSSTSFIGMATKPVKIECSVFGYPLSSSDSKLELRLVSAGAPFGLNVIGRSTDDIDEFSVSYEVVNQGELPQGSSYKLECYYQNTVSNVVQRKEIELKIAQKPNIPDVGVVCSGSSGIVFTYDIPQSDGDDKKTIKHVLTYASSEEFDRLMRKPSIVIPVKEKETSGAMTYVLTNLVASRNYTVKWESFNVFHLSNERILTYSTTDLVPPRTPKMMQFKPQEDMISVNITWQDKCPYVGSNSPIGDIVVSMKPLITVEGKDNKWRWTERNFTLEADKSSAQFLIYLENAQLDYEIQVELRSPQGTSESLIGIYKADTVLTGPIFSCFPRCLGNTVYWSISHFYTLFLFIFIYMMVK